jgi:hypothetical protein
MENNSDERGNFGMASVRSNVKQISCLSEQNNNGICLRYKLSIVDGALFFCLYKGLNA